MVVGIPFPNVKDSKVGLKKEYNNSAAATSAAAGRGGFYGGPAAAAAAAGAPPRLLTGDSWYSQQAFRALNQVGINHVLPLGYCVSRGCFQQWITHIRAHIWLYMQMAVHATGRLAAALKTVTSLC